MTPEQSDSERMPVADPALYRPRAALAPPRMPEAPARPSLSGCRLASPGGGHIYLVDPDGYRRRIPSYTAYGRLFRDWSGIVEGSDLDSIASRPDFAQGTILVRGDITPAVYLLDHGRRRTITGARVMDKYWFNPERVFCIRQVLIDHMPLGDDWE